METEKNVVNGDAVVEIIIERSAKRIQAGQFIDCIKRSAGILDDLVLAQNDAKIRVDAEIDLLEKEVGRPILPVEKTNIKKFAKAIASAKTDSLKDEAEGMANLIKAFFPESGGL